MLIKVVALAIPSYAMSVFGFSKELCSVIQSTINQFWWGHRPKDRKLHWLGSMKLYQSKKEGEMGFRDMEAFNKALLAKQLRRLITNPSSLVCQVLGARYYPYGRALDATLGPWPSYTWCSIWGAKDIILAGTCWLVVNGTSIHI